MDYTSKFNFEEQGDEEQSSEPSDSSKENAYYDTPGHIRNICFVMEDGSWTYLNYNYLINVEYHLLENFLLLCFTTHTVSIKGINLSALGFQIMSQNLKFISISNPRYKTLSDGNNILVDYIYISINKKQE